MKAPQNNEPPSINVFTNFSNLLSKKLLSCTKYTSEIANSALEAIKSKNKEKLCEISESGIPDDLQILRAFIWKINLGYLPLEITKWDLTLEKKRKEYKTYKELIKKKIRTRII